MRHLASSWFARQRFYRAFTTFIWITPVRVSGLLLAAILITLTLANNNAVADVMLQSPTSEAPADAEPAPAEPAPAEQEAAPAESEPAGNPEAPAADPAEPDSPVSPLPDDPAQTQQDGQALPPSLPEPVQPQPIDRTAPLPQSGGDDSTLIVDEAELIDTVIVTTAYVWLCCGIIIILLIPLVFLFLYIRGRSKIIKEEIY